jgi:hypothetical protein
MIKIMRAAAVRGRQWGEAANFLPSESVAVESTSPSE